MKVEDVSASCDDAHSAAWPRPLPCPPLSSPDGDDYASGGDEGWGSGSEGAGGRRQQRVAVVVAGQLFRFSWETLYQGVVKSNVEAGHHVVITMCGFACVSACVRGVHACSCL